MPTEEIADKNTIISTKRVKLVAGLGLHSWEVLMLWSLGFAALAACAVVVTTAVVLSLQKDAEAESKREFDKYKLEASEKISGANAEAAKANLELARLKAPRSLSLEQQAEITRRLREFAGQKFSGMVASSVPDAPLLWAQIAKSLTDAGWELIAPGGLAMGNPPAGVPIRSTNGVTVHIPQEMLNEFGKAGLAIGNALLDAGIVTEAFAGAVDSKAATPPRIIIQVGTKP